jgi:hypothetical protein
MEYAFCGFVVLFMLTLFGLIFYSIGHVVPTALRLWADAEGYRIIRREIGWPWDWDRHETGFSQQFYRITVRDKTGHARKGVVFVGTPYWLALSVRRCLIDVRWDLVEPSPTKVGPDRQNSSS